MVMGFVLELGEGGKPSQRTVLCGAFSDVEEAFGLARELAESQWRQLIGSCKVDVTEVNCSIEPTEYGYDIIHGPMVIERFWVHDKRPTNLFPS